MANPVLIEQVEVRSALTRTSGYLSGVCSHTLQPYRGCPLGRSLCGVGCYVQYNPWVARGQTWGEFLEVRTNVAERYRTEHRREQAWAHRNGQPFVIFLSSATEPFPPQERRLGATRKVLSAMLDDPPDGLIVQTHTPWVTSALDLLVPLADRCRVRVHLSIETDRDMLPGLPRPASTVTRRLEAAGACRASGLFTVVTVAPLLPIDDPSRFFEAIAGVADAVVIDHFIEGDGSRDGARTRRTRLPEALRAIDPETLELSYRDRIVEVARRYLPGRVGVGSEGFAGRWLPEGTRETQDDRDDTDSD